MRRRPLCLLLILPLLVPVSLAGAVTFDGDVNYVVSGGGTINFASDFTAALMDFDLSQDLIRFLEFSFGGTTYSQVGFACDTPGAVMNVTSVTHSLLEYTVTAPTGTTSHTRIYAPGKGIPESVSGAQNWLYDTGSAIITVTAEHTSPVEIAISWASVSPPGGPSGSPGTWPPPEGPSIPTGPITPTPSTGMINLGILVIIAVVASAAVWKEAEKRTGGALKRFKSRSPTASGGAAAKEFKKRRKK